MTSEKFEVLLAQLFRFRQSSSHSAIGLLLGADPHSKTFYEAAYGIFEDARC